MTEIMFQLDDEAFAQLQQYAMHEERSPHAQAKILLLKALDAYHEYKPKAPASKSRPKGVVKRPAPVPSDRVSGGLSG